MPQTTRQVRVFRYDPDKGGDGDFQSFELKIPNESATTMLDVLLRLQREQDPSLAFRFACRVNMCGSCGMVINGRERLACKTNVSDLPKGAEITLRPMNHFPIIKDLVVDMDPLFAKFRQTLSFFEPKEDQTEPAVIPPDAERAEIGVVTDCIACGCCVSSCTMVNHHEDYAGPAALARAYSLLADSRDGLFHERLASSLPSCHECRTEMNCTEVCPKGISPTRAIKFIQRIALTHHNGKPIEPSVPSREPEPQSDQVISRASFLRHAGVAVLGAAAVATLGGVAAVTTVGPSRAAKVERWIPIGKLSDFPADQVTTVMLNYDVKSGIYNQAVSTPVLVSRLNDKFTCYKSACPHLGCTVHWENQSSQFRCACHGGAFDASGGVVGGPPPRALDRYAFKLESDQLFVLV
jgi:succinate dehydrogenase / fumarate reductase, iron-sulfur subunit